MNELTQRSEMQSLQAQLRQASVKVSTLQVENRRLRRMTANGRAGRLLRRSADDAKQLCGWRWAGFSVSRRAALSYGLSRRRWHWAIAMLERSRVIAPDARYVDDAFEIDDIDDATAAIDKTVKVLESSGLASLEMRLPNNGAAGRRRSRN